MTAGDETGGLAGADQPAAAAIGKHQTRRVALGKALPEPDRQQAGGQCGYVATILGDPRAWITGAARNEAAPEMPVSEDHRPHQRYTMRAFVGLCPSKHVFPLDTGKAALGDRAIIILAYEDLAAEVHPTLLRIKPTVLLACDDHNRDEAGATRKMCRQGLP